MNLFRSIGLMKCPNCHKGNLFKKPFSLNTAFDMPEKCEECGHDYFPEPGFYYGAMFVGYIITSISFVGLMLLLIFGMDMTVEKSFLLLILFAVFTYIFFFRFARSVWIHIAPTEKKKKQESN